MLGLWVQMRDTGGGIGWLAAGDVSNSLSSALLSVSGMCFVLLFLSFCSFCFVFVFVFMLLLELVDVCLIFSCPADHVPAWQPPILLGMARTR